ncbi:hypothetical protein Tco_0683687 [Tanacetum coccineum]
MPLGPFHDTEEIIREREQDYDIPLNDGEDFSDITKVAEIENDNPVKDVMELSDIKTYDCETFIRKLLHQVPAARMQISSLTRPGIKSLLEDGDYLMFSANLLHFICLEAMLRREGLPTILSRGLASVRRSLRIQFGEWSSALRGEFMCPASDVDEVCAADELKTKKIIKFRLCGRAFSWTLLEFEKRLGLYNSEEIEDEGFDVYFQGGLRSDEHFNAQEYWLSISQEENLSLSRNHASTIWNPILRVFHKMITYGLCHRTTSEMDGEEMSCLSTLIYCRALDTTTLRDLIDSEGRLIPEAPEPGVPRVAIPRPPRASMQDLYERMGSMKICQGAIERMSYRQSYHWDKYAGVFEHIAGVYNVSLQRAYNPPGYDQH